MKTYSKFHGLPILLLAASAMIAPAQPAEAQALGYGLAGPAVYTGWFGGGPGFHFAGGGEVLVNERAGAGAEVGYWGNTGHVMMVSINGVARAADPGDKAVPYITGGYSRFSSGEGSFNAWNVGIGADFWKSDRAAVRVEFRDHIRNDSRGAVHYLTLRAGVAFK